MNANFVRTHLLLVITTLFTILTTSLSSLSLLSPHTTRSATTKWRSKSEIDVLLGVQSDDERWDVDNLLANSDVSLLDQDTGVVDGLGKAELVDTGLKSSLQEIFDFEGQDVIELHAGLIEDTDSDETSNQGVTFEETLGILLVESEQLTGTLSVWHSLSL